MTLSLPLAQSVTRKANALITSVVDAADDARNWRRNQGPKKGWSGHQSITQAQKLSVLDAALADLSTFLSAYIPDHWAQKHATFGYSLPLTSWWWQAGKKTAKQDLNGPLAKENLGQMVGFILATVALSQQPAKTDLTRMAGLGLSAETVNTYALYIKRSRRNTEYVKQQGLTPQDAFAQVVLSQTAPNGLLTVRPKVVKRSTFISRGQAAAEEAFAQAYDWSGAPSILPRLFVHPAIVSAFGTLTFKPDMDSVGPRDPKEFDSLLKLCLNLAAKATTEGPLKAYMLFTSPVHNHSVLGRCENGALLNYFFYRLCKPSKGRLPTNTNHILHICPLAHQDLS